MNLLSYNAGEFSREQRLHFPQVISHWKFDEHKINCREVESNLPDSVVNEFIDRYARANVRIGCGIRTLLSVLEGGFSLSEGFRFRLAVCAIQLGRPFQAAFELA